MRGFRPPGSSSGRQFIIHAPRRFITAARTGPASFLILAANTSGSILLPALVSGRSLHGHHAAAADAFAAATVQEDLRGR